mmetsp:Transcript_25383/g.70641  ORF Transcript_25383/g.70641 Transcript_25383/m.70641 type:complete len:228 (+) Transcript_25383:767-1450(+)
MLRRTSRASSKDRSASSSFPSPWPSKRKMAERSKASAYSAVKRASTNLKIRAASSKSRNAPSASPESSLALPQRASKFAASTVSRVPALACTPRARSKARTAASGSPKLSECTAAMLASNRASWERLSSPPTLTRISCASRYARSAPWASPPSCKTSPSRSSNIAPSFVSKAPSCVRTLRASCSASRAQRRSPSLWPTSPRCVSSTAPSGEASELEALRTYLAQLRD